MQIWKIGSSAPVHDVDFHQFPKFSLIFQIFLVSWRAKPFHCGKTCFAYSRAFRRNSHTNLVVIRWIVFEVRFLIQNIVPKTSHPTDPEIKGKNIWHISENRVENPENQQNSNCCKNRAGWWILTKPTPNGSSRIIFSKFFWILNFRQFFYVL